MSILGNFVRLVPDKPKRLKLTRPRIEERIIRDPKTGRTKVVRALVFDVLEEDGLPVSKIFSTLSEKLAAQLLAIWEHRRADYIDVTIIWHPRDFATEYEVIVH